MNALLTNMYIQVPIRVPLKGEELQLHIEEEARRRRQVNFNHLNMKLEVLKMCFDVIQQCLLVETTFSSALRMQLSSSYMHCISRIERSYVAVLLISAKLL
jgi:hypothetical protein